MAFLLGTIDFKVYTDSSQTDFPTELVPQISKEFANSTVTEIQSTTITLVGAASQVISFNGVGTVKRWYLYSSATDLTVNPNAIGNLTFQAQEPGFCPITLSSLTITNASPSVDTIVTLVMIAS